MAFKPALLALTAALGLAAPAAAECKFTKLGEIPVVIKGHRPLVEATINGKKAVFIVDTGASFSTLSTAAATRLGMKAGFGDGFRSVGISGSTALGLTKAKEMQLGNFISHDIDFTVRGEGLDSDEIAGLLGQNYFADDDIEFDFANEVIRLFRPVGCEKAPLAYWSQSFAIAKIGRVARSWSPLRADVQINGKAVEAMFDTGSPTSLLSLQSATLAGITPDHPDAKAAPAVYGLGSREFDRAKERVEAWVAPMGTFTIGDETIKNPRITIADIEQNVPREVPTGSHVNVKTVDMPRMLLGFDFFRSHRVYFAHSQQKMYFTYNGGPVFEAREAVASR